MSESKDFLIVDDDAVVRESLLLRLSHLSYDCVTAQNPTEAKEKLKCYDFKGAILDIMMPIDFEGKIQNEAGIELAKEIKQEYPKMRIVFLTAHGKDIYRTINQAVNEATINWVHTFHKPPPNNDFKTTLSFIAGK